MLGIACGFRWLWILVLQFLLLAQILNLSLQLVHQPLVVRPVLPHPIQKFLCLSRKPFVFYASSFLNFRAFVNFLVESYNSLSKPLSYLISVLNICLYILLVGLYPIYKLLYLLIPSGHELRLGINRIIAKIFDLIIQRNQPLLDCIPISLNQDEGGV